MVVVEHRVAAIVVAVGGVEAVAEMEGGEHYRCRPRLTKTQDT